MAKVYLQNKDRTDTPMLEFLRLLETEIPILLLSRMDEFELNEEIYELRGKSFVVVDVIEGGWDVEIKETLIVGQNTFDFEFTKGDGWLKLHEFLMTQNPRIYFKRELLEKDRTDLYLPIEYPNWQADYELQLREEFESRPITAYQYWGRSHEARLMLAGEFWKHAAKKGYAVCDNIWQFNLFMQYETNPIKLVTFHMPFYSRIDISELMKINAMSKLSISLYGCGRKCFRNTGESIVNSICVLPEDGLAYSMPFIDGVNCIKFPANDVTGMKEEWPVMETVDKAISGEVDLYSIYLESKKLADFYRVENFSKYIANLINTAV